MRALLLSTALFAGVTAHLSGGIPSPFDLTVVLNFAGPHSTIAILEMEAETARILGSSGVRLRWSSLGAGSVDTDLVVMNFTGSCQFGAPGPQHPGPLAVTLMVAGRIKPFGQVYCDRVSDAARSAMSQDQYPYGDRLMGRALGRVVAHELFHMVTGSRRHGYEGAERPALTGEELITESLLLGVVDAYRIRRQLKTTCGPPPHPVPVSPGSCRVLEQADVNAN